MSVRLDEFDEELFPHILKGYSHGEKDNRFLVDVHADT